MLHSIAAELDYVICLGESICDIVNYCLDLLEADDALNTEQKTKPTTPQIMLEERDPDYDIMAPGNETQKRKTRRKSKSVVQGRAEEMNDPGRPYVKFTEQPKTHMIDTYHVLNSSVVSENS